MMMKIVSLLMKNKARQSLNTIKNFWWYASGLIAAGIVCLYFCAYNISVIREHSLYINAGVALVLFYLFFSRRLPIISINPATIHFLNSRQLVNYILYLKFFAFLPIFLAISLLLSLVISSQFSFLHFFHALSLFFVWLLLTWQKYHHSLGQLVLFSEMLTAVVLYLAQNFIMGNIFNIFILILQMKRFTSISFETFVSDMKYSYGAQAAVARKDFGLLLAYANSTTVKESYRLPYPNCPNIHPIFAKSLVDTLRISKRLWFLKIGSFILSLFVLINDIAHPYSIYIFIITWSTTITLVIKHSTQALVTLKAKSDLGLSIPYQHSVISGYYSILPIIQIVLLNVFLAIFTPLSTILIICATLLNCIITFFWHQLCICNYFHQRIIDSIGSLIIILLSILITL